MYSFKKKPFDFLVLKGISSIVLFVTLLCLTVSAQTLTLDSLQRRFVDKRFGMFIHFNMNTYSPGWANNRVDPKLFNPTNLDCAQWAAAAKAAKMTYGVLTCKHHDGFSIWPSKAALTPPNGKTPYTIAQSSQPNMDVVKSYTTAFRAAGLWPGLYMSMFDVANGVPRDSATKWTPAIRAFILGQITELLTNYGEIPIFWFDGYAWAIGHWAIPWQEIRDTIKALQPNCIIVETNGMVTQTWESDATFVEEGGPNWIPTGNTYAAVQASSILTNNRWFWDASATSGTTIKTAANIVTTHLNALNPNYCNYQLNCPPNRTGQMDASIVSRLAEVGNTWSPNLSRPPLPKQPLSLEHPITPVAVTATSGTALNAVDGFLDRANATAFQTLWQSTGTLPQSVTLDLGKSYDNIAYLFYMPRRETGNTTGNITSYRIYTSVNGTTFTQITTGTAVGGGTFGTWAADANIKRVSFTPQTARYVRLEAVAAAGGGTAVICDLSVGASGISTNVIPFAKVHAAGQLNTGGVMVNGHFTFSPAYAGMARSVAVYDFSGKLLGIKTLTKNSVDMQKDFGLQNGAYIVKVKSASEKL
jgi:alpha-L-fucosidase